MVGYNLYIKRTASAAVSRIWLRARAERPEPGRSRHPVPERRRGPHVRGAERVRDRQLHRDVQRDQARGPDFFLELETFNGVKATGLLDGETDSFDATIRYEDINVSGNALCLMTSGFLEPGSLAVLD